MLVKDAAILTWETDNTEPKWRIELLGGVRLQGFGVALSAFKTRRMTRLPARLACFPDQAHPRDVLAEELWPEDAPDAIRERFRQTLALLRHELEPAGVPSGSVLAADRSTVRLQSGAFSTDVHEFKTAFREAAGEADPQRRIDLLHSALSYCGGELLLGYDDD